MQRRTLLKSLGLLGLTAMYPFAGAGGSPGVQSSSSSNSKNPNNPKMVFFNKLSNEFEYLNNLALAHYRFADIGEMLAIRELINENEAETGVQAYLKFAETCKNTADKCLTKGHTQSACNTYFRASTYYFGATSFLDASPDPERFGDIWKKHRDCWNIAMGLMDISYEQFNIPYEGKTLPGFFIKKSGDDTPRPLYIFNNGSDGPISAMWAWGGFAALERGYNVLTFDGPGQGASLFQNDLYFRPDWEKVITPVIDSIINRPDVDKNSIVLYGISQAGYWAPRAAAFEKRIKALIADPGVVDVSTSWMSGFPKEMIELFDSGNKADFNKYMEEGFKQNPVSMAEYNFRARPYGINDPFDLLTAVKQYNLYDVAGNIECPTIIADPEDEQFWPGQPQELYGLLKCPKQIIQFTEAEGANYHCEPKSRLFWEQMIFDALDEILGLNK